MTDPIRSPERPPITRTAAIARDGVLVACVAVVVACAVLAGVELAHGEDGWALVWLILASPCLFIGYSMWLFRQWVRAGRPGEYVDWLKARKARR